MTPPPYKKPPIAEAIVELRFGDGSPWAKTEELLLSSFSETHQGKRRSLRSYQVQAEWQDGALSTQSDDQFSRWLLPNDLGTELIGIGADVLSVHVVAPYPGWAIFRPAIDRAFARYVEVASPKRLAGVSVRYVDQILLPEDAEIGAYFLALPTRLKSQPKELAGFQVTTEAIETQSGIRSRLTLLSGPRTNDGHRVVIYDLDLSHQPSDPTPADAWPTMVELLHDRQKAIFEESITQKTRELFK